MSVYPATLPQYPLLQGFEDKRQPATIRSQMDQGAPKTRKKFTAAIRNLKFPTVLDGTQRGTFDTFFITTINEGADTFTIPDPVDGSTITVKFTEPPTWSIVLSKGTSVADRHWKSTYSLEVLP